VLQITNGIDEQKVDTGEKGAKVIPVKLGAVDKCVMEQPVVLRCCRTKR